MNLARFSTVHNVECNLTIVYSNRMVCNCINRWDTFTIICAILLIIHDIHLQQTDKASLSWKYPAPYLHIASALSLIFWLLSLSQGRQICHSLQMSLHVQVHVKWFLGTSKFLCCLSVQFQSFICSFLGGDINDMWKIEVFLTNENILDDDALYWSNMCELLLKWFSWSQVRFWLLYCVNVSWYGTDWDLPIIVPFVWVEHGAEMIICFFLTNGALGRWGGW